MLPYTAAMAPFSALNRLENDHPIPLMYYYRSFVERGEEPNEKARLALEQAMQLAPFDKSLRMNAAMMQASEGKIAIARQTIAPIANDPHGGGLAQTARRFYEAMAGVEEGTAWNPGATLDLATAIADAARDDDTGSDQ